MKTIRELKIKDWSGYFMNISWLMTLKVVKMVQYYLIYVILTKMAYHILFLVISNVFFKKVESIVI